MELFRRGICVAPKIDANASGAQAGVDLCAIVGGDAFWRELRCGRPHFVNHDGVAGALRKSDFEGRSIRGARGEQRIGKEIRRVQSERMNAEEVNKLSGRLGQLDLTN